MKIRVLLFVFFMNTMLYAQIRELKVSGYDYFVFKNNKMYFYKQLKKGGLSSAKFFAEIKDGSIKKIKNPDSKKIIQQYKDTLDAPLLKIKDLNTHFSIIKEFGNKIYGIKMENGLYLYFLKNEDIKNLYFYYQQFFVQDFVWKRLQSSPIFLYRINLGKDRFVYMFPHMGIIFKKDGMVKIDVPNLINSQNIVSTFFKNKDSVDVPKDYFDFGKNKIIIKARKVDSSKIKYIGQAVSKNGNIIIDNLIYNYYNNKALIEIKPNTILMYDTNLQVKSYPVRDMIESNNHIIFLSGNEILAQSIENFKPRQYSEHIGWLCGSGMYYSLLIDKNKITRIEDDSFVGKTVGKTSMPMTINTTVSFDSILFFDGSRKLEWLDNTSLLGNNNIYKYILLFKKGKQGLYEIGLNDSIITFNEIVPPLFDKIYMLNNQIILQQGKQKELLDYYLSNKKMRFISIKSEKDIPYYLRYEKSSHQKGWINQQGILFDDLL